MAGDNVSSTWWPSNFYLRLFTSLRFEPNERNDAGACIRSLVRQKRQQTIVFTGLFRFELGK